MLRGRDASPATIDADAGPSRQKWGKPRPTVPSRFLYEITGQTKSPNYQAARQGRRPTKPGSRAVKKHLPPVKQRLPAVKRPVKKPPGPTGTRPYGPP